MYYESLCPDSRKFITQQLYPTYQNLSQNLDVEFKPFGKASVSDRETAAKRIRDIILLYTSYGVLETS